MPHEPPHSKRPPPHRHRHSLSSLAETADADTLRDALALVLGDPRDAAFVARCIVAEGPAHHRAASWGLLVVAAAIARKVGCDPAERTPPGAVDEGETVSIPMRLPPHLARDEQTFPLAMPLGPLRGVVHGERELQALADALVDGPPHHALANAALIALFDRILRALARGEPGSDPTP